MGGKLSVEANTANINPTLASRYPDQLFVKVLVNKTRWVDVHLKPCSTYNFIQPKLAKQLGLKLFATSKEVNCVAGEVTKYNEKCYVSLKMHYYGSLRIDDVECVLRNSSDRGQPMITLGHDFLRNFKRVSIVYGGKRGKVFAYPDSNISMINIMINKVLVKKAHIYSSSDQSLMSLDFAQRLMLPLCRIMNGATLKLSGTSDYGATMFCLVDLAVGEELHKDFKFLVVENLFADVLLGVDFISQHGKIKLLYGGRIPRLLVTRVGKAIDRLEDNFVLTKMD